jgi:hypothetical protein
MNQQDSFWPQSVMITHARSGTSRKITVALQHFSLLLQVVKNMQSKGKDVRMWALMAYGGMKV